MTTELVWEQFSNRLHLFINSKVNNRDDAEDILQDVFLKIHDNLHNLQNIQKIESWIYQITRNTITDYYRKLDSHFHLPEDLMSQVDEQDLKKDISKCLIGMIDELPSKYKMPLRSSYLEHKTQKTIALEIGISLPGAKSRIQRGRSLLKNILKKCCNIESSEQTCDCE
jgi:RNA polymerase sigma-70 factor, ECF subfamily